MTQQNNQRGKTATLAELASLTESRLVGNPDHPVSGFADLQSAKGHEVSFLSNPRYTPTCYEKAMHRTDAGAIFISPHIPLPEGKNFLINEDPSRAFQQTIEMMRGGAPKLSYFEGIHPSAVIHETAHIGEHAAIGPLVVVDAHAVIHDHCFIGAGSYIGPRSTLGKHCIIHPNVTIREHCHLGLRVVVQSGAIIGSDGLGFTTDGQGKHTRLNQIGIVIIEDDVEVGANCTIDRARFVETRIGEGTKLDHLIIIGHNVQVGKHNMICGQSAIAGSSRTGDRVIIAGQCGISGHIELENDVIITAKSGVSKSLRTSGKYGGIPVQPLSDYNRNATKLRKIGMYADQIKRLEQRIEALEHRINDKEREKSRE
ncbi:MAG: UDP-3-O-(3-hydroxymyristoyl)glucosamine N-acyltransferase [Waddliaceae bacterium]